MAKRENGSGTIRKVSGANGTKYYAYAPARYETIDEVRKCIREPLGSFSKKTEAREAIEKFVQRPSAKYNFSIEQVYEEWKSVAFDDISKQTQDNYRAAWKQIKYAWGNKIHEPIRERTTAEIRAIYDYWMDEHEIMRQGRGKPFKTKAGPLSKSAMQKIKALLTQLYKYCMANNIVHQNYASLVNIPKGAEEGKQRALTDLEFAQLEKNYMNVPGGDACYVLCYTGWRVTEFCQLTRFSYDPKEKTLRGGLKSEAGRDRVVPVHPKIQEIVERWYKNCNGPLYPRPDGKAYNKDTFRDDVWNPCMDALGLPSDLTPHSARHTYGTKLSAAGARPEDIKELMGHSDYSVTANTYINQDLAPLRNAVNLIK